MTTCALCAATTAHAQNLNGIQNHAVQNLFLTQPCKEAIEAIDKPTADPEAFGKMAMGFGFLMGFEVAHPGIRGDHETVLMRLRGDCAANPDTTAMVLLWGYAAKTDH